MNSRSRLAAFRNFGLSLGLPRFHPFPPGLFPPHLAMARPPGLFPPAYQLLPHPRHHHHLLPALPQELLMPRLPLPPHHLRGAPQEEEERSSLASSPPSSSYLGQESLLLLRARVMSTPARPGDSPPLPSSNRLFIKAEPDLSD